MPSALDGAGGGEQGAIVIRFHGKSSWWLMGLTALFLLLPFLLMALRVPAVASAWPTFALALLGSTCLVRNHVDLHADRIEIFYGLWTRRISLDDIMTVDHTRFNFPVTVNSLDCVHLSCHGEDGYTDQVIALRDNDAFITALNARRCTVRRAIEAAHRAMISD